MKIGSNETNIELVYSLKIRRTRRGEWQRNIVMAWDLRRTHSATKKKKNVVKYKVLSITWKWKTIKKCFCAIYLLTIGLSLFLARSWFKKRKSECHRSVFCKINIVCGTRWIVCKLLKSSSFPFTFFIISRAFERMPNAPPMNFLVNVYLGMLSPNERHNTQLGDKIGSESVKCNFVMCFF